jgi:hypothetical protein
MGRNVFCNNHKLGRVLCPSILVQFFGSEVDESLKSSPIFNNFCQVRMWLGLKTIPVMIIAENFECFRQCCGSRIRCSFDSGTRDGKNPDPGPGIWNKIPEHISNSLVTIFWV